MLNGVTVDGGPRDWRRELMVPLVDVLVKVLLVHQPVQVEEAGLPDEGEDNKLESTIFSVYRVTIQGVPRVLLTSTQRLQFSIWTLY